MPDFQPRSSALWCRTSALAAVALIVGATLFAQGCRNGERDPEPQTGDGQPSASAEPAVAPERADDAPDATEPSPPDIPFVDVTSQAGVDFLHRGGATGDKMLPESGGSGCALFDYDGDDDLDLLLLRGHAWPWDEAPSDDESSTVALYRNDDAQFTDVTAEAGLTSRFYAQGAAVGDVDSDGDDDLFITALGTNRFYRNDGGAFVEAADEVGLAGGADDWTTSAGYFDYDRDGDLDLFVCNYMRWSREFDEAATMRIKGTGRSYAHPSNFDGVHNYLYRNDGGRFTNVSAEAGIHVDDPATGKPLGKGLAVTFVDFDGDGWLDVLVANDTVRHFLFRNRGDGTFEEIGQESGFAFNAAGATTSGMGVDAAWVFNDRRLAAAVSNFAGEMTELYVAQDSDQTFFADEAVQLGVGRPTYNMLTFGLLLDDLDQDGLVDLVHANGHLEETINEVAPDQRYAQPAQVFWNTGNEQRLFVELPAEKIGDLAKPIVGRGVASGDLDGDGDLDLMLTQVGGPPLVARNDQATGHHWLRVRLEGPAGNPHAIGAVVELRAGGVTQRRTVMPTRSYLSYCDPVVTFGLGDATEVDGLTVTWPDGTVEQAPPPAVDQVVAIGAPVTSFAALANRAKAELENGEFESAVGLLRDALKLQPESLAMRRNLVRAYLMSNRPAEATEELDRLTETTAADAGTFYLRGLAALRATDFERAAENFEQAVELDPGEPTLRFQWALALLGLNRGDDARVQFEKAAELEPLHGAAQYQLAALARKAGDQAAYGRYMRDYLRIRELRGAVSSAALEACRYTVAEAAETITAPPRAAPSPVEFSAADLPIEGAEGLAIAAIGVTAVEDSGRYRLAAIAETGEVVAAEFDAAGHLRQTAQSAEPLGDVGPVAALLVGNALVDPQVEGAAQGDQSEIAIVTPNRTWLLRTTGDDGFEDLSASSRLEAAAGTTARWVDVDHDGDIDLCLANADGLHVWRNNGDGTFVDATADYGLADAGSSVDLAAADFDGTNLGVDLALASTNRSTLFRHQLAGKFARDDDASGAWPDAARLLVDDFSNDGLADVAFVNAGSTTIALAGIQQRQSLVYGFGELDAACTVDVDNDGWLDVAVVVEGLGYLLRNVGGQFAEAPQALEIAGDVRARQLHDLDADGDGDTDLVVLGADGRLRLLKNETTTTNKQLKLAVNSYVGHPSSIGVRVQVRAEDHVVTRWTNRELPIEIGMGSHDEADSIQTLWPNGIAKNEIGVRVTMAPVRISVVEFIRTDSCPFLYAYRDGQWRFLNDLLGTAPLNVVVARGVLMPGNPNEAVVLGAAEEFADGDVAARLRVTSELREVVFVDQIQLLAVDHPADTTLFSCDRVTPTLVEGPQFLIGRAPIELRSAVASDGVDRTAALVAEDGRFAPPGRVLPPPIVGFTEPLSLDLDFGDLGAADDLLLALTGWFRFGNSSSNIAASQRGDLPVIWPKLQAAAADGQWQPVDVQVGLPAGNTKTIVCDLRGKLPPGAVRLRLTTSLEVRWDRIALYHAADVDALRVTAVAPSSADLQWHGFSELRPRGSNEPQEPNLDRIAERPPWTHVPAGWCTRYGEIAPLVAHADGQYAILNSGDGATLSFPASGLPEPQLGWTRTLVQFTRGWIKAADPNSEPDVEAWPFPGSEAVFDVDRPDADWQLRYNTRWVPQGRFKGP